MKNQTVLVVGPKVLKDKIYNKRIIYFLDDKFYHYDQKEKKNKIISISDLPINYKESYTDNREKIYLSTLKNIWFRWLRNEKNLKLKEETILLDIIKVRQFLKKKNIKKIIFYTFTPHHISTSIISFNAFCLKIKELFVHKAHVFKKKDSYMIIEGSGIFVEQKLPKNLYAGSNIDEELNYLIDTLKKNNLTYVLKHRVIDKNFFLSFVKILLINFREKFFSKNTNYGVDKVISVFDDLKEFINQKKFLENYNTKCIKYDKFKKYPQLIIAAHYQPEASTVPLGGSYKTHLDLVLKLRSMGYDREIYYKEHQDSKLYTKKRLGRTGVGGFRSKKYLDNLEALNVKFLPYELDLKNNKKDWVLTITGKIAAERSLLGLQTIVAGNSWINLLPNVLHLDRIDLKKLYSKPIKSTSYNRKKTINFLKKNCKGNFLPSLQNNDNNSLKIHIKFINQTLNSN